MTARELRVLMTADAVGGVFGYAADLCRELIARNARVLLVVLGPAPSPTQEVELRGIGGLELVVAPHALEWQDEPWEGVDRSGQLLLELAQKFEPSVVHSNQYAHGALDFGAPVLVVAHSCVSSWWRAVLDESLPERYGPYRERVARGLRGADLVVAPSGAMLEALRSEYGFTGPAQVIHNGADATRCRRAPKQPRFLAAGRLWDRAKNVELLRSIAPQLPWPLEVAGDAGGARLEPPLVGSLSREALALRMSEAAVFLHPARYEPFGLAPLEAALAGCALVLSELDSLREIWGEAAIYCDPEDPAAWLEAAARLAGDAELCAELGERAHRRALRFSIARTAEQYLQAYALLMRSTEPPSEARLLPRGVALAATRHPVPSREAS